MGLLTCRGAAKKKGQNKGPHPLPSSPVPGLNLTDHAFRVPLDHAVGPSGGMIDLFAREAVAAARAGPAPRDSEGVAFVSHTHTLWSYEPDTSRPGLCPLHSSP